MEFLSMILGQSAATGAALAIETGVDWQNVSQCDLRDRLRARSREDGNGLQAWTSDVTPDGIHIIHDFWVARFDGESAEDLLAASCERAHLLDPDASSSWEALRLGPEFHGPDIHGVGLLQSVTGAGATRRGAEA